MSLSEKEIADWLSLQRRCLQEGSSVKGVLHEMLRFLEEALCPTVCAEARSRLTELARQERIEAGLDGPVIAADAP